MNSLRVRRQSRKQLFKIMDNLINNRRKLIFSLSILTVLSLLIFNWQNSLIQVSAQAGRIMVSIPHLGFGNVFPGEQLDNKTFMVSYTDPSGQVVDYKIVQKHKPLLNAVPPVEYEGTINQYCQDNPTDYTRCYRYLCQYLTKNNAEGEGDIENDASVGPNDSTDTWTVGLKVPGIVGHISQDHDGGIISEAGDYGCDISVEAEDLPLPGCQISGYKFYDTNHNGIFDQGESGLPDWTISLNLPASEKLIEELDAPATGGVVTTVSGLINGQDYRIEASGTYFAGGTNLEDIEADAKFSQDDFQAANSLPWTDLVHNYESYGPELLNLKVNDVFVDWGSFAANHIYSLNFTGLGSQANFQIYDIAPDNNTGSLHIKIYKKIAAFSATTITDNYGFYCFSELAGNGLYTVNEVLKNDWTNSTPVSTDVDYQGLPLVNKNFGNYQNIRTSSSNGGSGGGFFLASSQNSSETQSQPEILGEMGAPRLTVTKTVAKNEANPGEKDIAYTIKVKNDGNLTAFNVKVDDILPAGLSFATGEGQTKTWELGNIAPNETKEITYNVNIDEDAKIMVYTNTATAYADNHPKVSANISLEVKEVAVLGAQLTPTGFDIREFYALISLSALFLLMAFILRREFILE